MAICGASAVLGCDREARPGAARKPADAPAAAVAPAAEPSGDVAGESEQERDATGRREGAKDFGLEQAAGGGGLAHATGAQLLASIKASGKRGTLVNAWASWCGPCRREIPMLQALAANLKPQGVEIVLVSVDEPKDEAKAQSFLKDNGITLRSYLVEGSVADFKLAINPNWPGMLPASFLFDRSARLIHFWGGEAFENEIVPVVENFLAGKAVEAETRFGLAPGKVNP
ncbi:MAG TPA: TlpA disulfide reductase family protein [Polyangiaceae bacterium]|nr:TlpA disulfide reductase family protein [Polyangiaceae bacterium]